MNKRFIVTGLLVLVSLFLVLFFPTHEQVSPIFQGWFLSIAFFLVIPFLYCKIVLKESLKNIGLQKGNLIPGVMAGMFGVGGALLAVFFVSRYTIFDETAFFPVAVETNFIWFVLYELVLVSLTALLYEVFFRGFVQILWLRNAGFWAIIIQSLLFFGMIFLSGEMHWANFPFLLFAPLSGVIAYISQSIWYSWAASWLFFFLTDIFLLIQK